MKCLILPYWVKYVKRIVHQKLNSVIIHLPSCCSNPVCFSIFARYLTSYIHTIKVNCSFRSSVVWFPWKLKVKVKKVKWRVASHTRNLCSAFNPSKCTHTAGNTHCGQPMLRHPGSSWGLGALLKVERALVIHSPPQTIPAGPETQTCDLRVTNPTLYPLGHNCPQKLFGKTVNSSHVYNDTWTFVSIGIESSKLMNLNIRF